MKRFALFAGLCLLGCDKSAPDYRQNHAPLVYENLPHAPVRTAWGIMSWDDYQEMKRLRGRTPEPQKKAAVGVYAPSPVESKAESPRGNWGR